MKLTLAAAPADCPPTSASETWFSWSAAAILVIGVTVVLLLARRQQRRPGKLLYRVGLVLAILGLLVLELCFIMLLVRGDMDQCGDNDSAATWIGLLGLLAFLMGMLLTMRATWGAITCIALLDLAIGISLIGGLVAGRQELGTAVFILLVHGGCTSVASFWSWRLLKSEDAVARARASEAGRILAAAWVVLVVFSISAWAFGPDNPSLKLSDSVAFSVFVVAAIGVVMGTGYTKYVEASTSYRKELVAVEPRGSAPATAAALHPTLASILTLVVVAAHVLRRTDSPTTKPDTGSAGRARCGRTSIR